MSWPLGRRHRLTIRPVVRVLVPLVAVGMTAAAASADPGRREPYLGVVTAPVHEQLRAHLGLPAGLGLVVEAVAKDGPAGGAGVRRFDILQKFDDQLICTAEQLSTLVRAAGKGKEVRITLIRAGREEEVVALLEERDVAGSSKAGRPEERKPPSGFPAPGLPGFGERPRAPGQRQFQQSQTAGSSQSVVVVADQRGTVEIRETDGKRTVMIRKSSGEELHRGPLDTAADREKVPEAFREMVDEVENQLGGRGRRPSAEADTDDNEI